MRYQHALLPTLKEAPSDATSVSHVLLLRGGFVRRVGAGIYSFLPLGVRVLRKIETIIRRELDRAGAEEVLLPALLPAEYFQESGRWEVFGDTLLRLKDRKGADYHLGPTHEEIITDLARREIRSYRDLPKNLYQIQTKFRDEPRPRGGLLRCREFSMKDAYSFDATEEAARVTYEKMRVAYRRIFDQLGLDYRMVAADSGAMGGSGSAEFQVLVQSGEDQIAACTACEHAANLEIATTTTPAVGPEPDAVPPREQVATPGAGTIEDVSRFLEAPPERFLKSLLYVAGNDIAMAVVRGDHEVNEVKLARVLGAREVFLASANDIEKATGAAVGFAGPVGFSGRLLVDRDAAAVRDAITGANATDAHFVHVVRGRDYEGEVVDLRNVREGDACPRCGASLRLYRGIEAGHIFLLGTHYTAKMGATYLDEKGENKHLVMGCYGIGVSRLVATAIEQHHDDNGIRWPISIAPYHVHIVALGTEPSVKSVVDKLERELEARGIDVLVDDRDDRPGVKFKDADLVGVPFRVTVGAKSLERGGVELKARTEPDPKRSELIPREGAAEAIAARVRSALAAIAPG
ncbi:MAG: proline--tRNA ligase [Polyangiaceae bacterium]|nr:proline--tRNA ligase [Polyangiaceae bacterium]